jgi:7,8-dihydropterin-6-yl-methyl-4-(beta-D-ribofuranosyl)aminobenzene 5'-phosphate synthase
MRLFASVLLLLTAAAVTASAADVSRLNVRILSTMLADSAGYGEWGFAALVEADGHRILFDTGAHPDTVLRNLEALKIDISDVEEVILSHYHMDHTAGLTTLRRELSKRNPKALSKVHVARGMFYPRPTVDFRNPRAERREANTMIATKAAYEATGGKFVEHTGPVELYPGIWLTGPVVRKYPERNWSGSGRMRGPGGEDLEDNLPEDMTLVIETARGLVAVAGCSHAGIVNILDHARTKIRNKPVHAIIGGFHLFNAKEETLAFTAAKFREFGLRNFLGAHCTGIEAVYRLRELAGLDRKTAAVGALGGGFNLDEGLIPGSIAR